MARSALIVLSLLGSPVGTTLFDGFKYLLLEPVASEEMRSALCCRQPAKMMSLAVGESDALHL